MRALRFLTPLLLAAAAAGGSVYSDEEEAALDACDRLGLTAVKDLPLVAVTEVRWVSEDGPVLGALEDTRLTRTVGFWRNFVYSHHVVRVGSAAHEVLQNITGRQFRGEEWTPAKIREWWEGYGPDGEVRFLRERCEAATGWARGEALERLAARSAKDALEVAWHATEREGVQLDQMTGDGGGWNASCGFSAPDDSPPPEDPSPSPFILPHIERLLHRATRDGGIVDIGIRQG